MVLFLYYLFSTMLSKLVNFAHTTAQISKLYLNEDIGIDDSCFLRCPMTGKTRIYISPVQIKMDCEKYNISEQAAIAITLSHELGHAILEINKQDWHDEELAWEVGMDIFKQLNIPISKVYQSIMNNHLDYLDSLD